MQLSCFFWKTSYAAGAYLDAAAALGSLVTGNVPIRT